MAGLTHRWGVWWPFPSTVHIPSLWRIAVFVAVVKPDLGEKQGLSAGPRQGSAPPAPLTVSAAAEAAWPGPLLLIKAGQREGRVFLDKTWAHSKSCIPVEECCSQAGSVP